MEKNFAVWLKSVNCPNCAYFTVNQMLTYYHLVIAKNGNSIIQMQLLSEQFTTNKTHFRTGQQFNQAAVPIVVMDSAVNAYRRSFHSQIHRE